MKFFSAIIFVFSFFIQKTNSQTTIENIVFEGAGIRGIAYSGAIKEMEKKGILQNIKRIGGTSAGAITALTLALGYTSDEIAAIINSTSFKKFNDGRFIFPGGIYRLTKNFGWYRGKELERWIGEIIKSKTGNAEITFAEMKNAGYKDLYVTGTSLNQQKLIIFSYETFPKMKVKDAVRISMSIPLYFGAVFIDSSGKKVTKKDAAHVMVDGGFTGNFPIKIFDSTRYINDAENTYFINHRTVGFRIDDEDQIRNDSSSKELASMPVKNLNQYISAFYNIIIENLNRQTLVAEDWERTVSINDASIGPRIRKLKKNEINALVENGEKATATFFEKN